jgi:hypothetical protein
VALLLLLLLLLLLVVLLLELEVEVEVEVTGCLSDLETYHGYACDTIPPCFSTLGCRLIATGSSVSIIDLIQGHNHKVGEMEDLRGDILFAVATSN